MMCIKDVERRYILYNYLHVVYTIHMGFDAFFAVSYDNEVMTTYYIKQKYISFVVKIGGTI